MIEHRTIMAEIKLTISSESLTEDDINLAIIETEVELNADGGFDLKHTTPEGDEKRTRVFTRIR